MKVWVYESDNGSVVFSNRPKDFGMVFIGTLDLDVQTEKKWKLYSKYIPLNAKNVKVTYEVEE